MNPDSSNGKVIPNWQVTATTIHCELVGHEATIMVYKDWTTACAYHQRWGPIRKARKRGIGYVLAWLGLSSEEKHIPADCRGPGDCPYVSEYRDKLFSEELAQNKDESRN